MSARLVNYSYAVPMSGFDHHNGLYYVNLFNGMSPGPPLPPMPIPPGMGFDPFTLHWVFMTSNGGHFGMHVKADRNNPTVLANGSLGSIVSRNHECRSMHVPPGGNLLVLATNLFASTKFFLGVGSVRAGRGPVASTVQAWFGHNLNCGDPMSHFLSNAIFAPGTVQVQPQPADFAVAGAEWAASAVVELAASWGYGKLASWVKPYVNRIPWPKWAVFGPNQDAVAGAKKAAADAVDDVIKHAGRDEVGHQAMDQGGRRARDAVREAINEGSDAAFEAEKQAAVEAARKEAERLIMEEGMPPKEAAREAARKVARDYFEETMKPGGGRLKHGTEKAIQESADAAAEKAAQGYKPGPGEAKDAVPTDTIPGAGVDAAGDKAKAEAGDLTEAKQKEWVVDPVKEETGASDE